MVLLAGPALAKGQWLSALTQQAEAGDAAAQLDLAVYLHDHGDAGQKADAVKWYRAAAAAGNAEALFHLGEIYRDGGLGVPANWNKGMSLLQKAADKGNGDAIFALDYCCSDRSHHADMPYAPPQDATERLRWDIRMMDRLDNTSRIEAMQSQIGDLISDGFGADITPWRIQFQLTLEAADDGDASAAEDVAADYLSGEGVKPDMAQAEKWYQVVADDGDITHQLEIAHHYEQDDFGSGKESMALIYYRRAADALRAKADAGDVSAQERLAALYDNGKLGADDGDAQAFDLYGRAARAGDVAAQAGLGRLYISGKGTAVDTDEGLRWLTRAANNDTRKLTSEDEADALSGRQLDLARLYYDGKAVPQNDYLALYWFEVGLSNVEGDISTEYQDLRNEVGAKVAEAEKRLSPEQAEQARNAVRNWHVRYGPQQYTQK